MMSLPSWERGLKSTGDKQLKLPWSVAPLVGAWIEITVVNFDENGIPVAPLVGAWIEIDKVRK